MKGVLTLWFVALHGFSVLEQSGAFHTLSRTRNDNRRTPRNPGLPSAQRTFPSNDQSIYRIRGGSWEDTASTSSSLSGVARSVGIADAIIPSGIFGLINSFFKHHPFLASFLICAVKASSADCFAQFASLQKSSVECNNSNDEGSGKPRSSRTTKPRFCFKRNLALLFYGGLYQGCGQELIYNNLFSALFGTGSQLGCVAKKVTVDMLLVQPLVSLPIAYLIKAPIFGQTIAEALRNYGDDIRLRGLLKRCWMVWMPAQTVIFTVVPKHLRIACMACVSFFWIILFSSISSASSTTTTSSTTSSTTTKQ